MIYRIYLFDNIFFLTGRKNVQGGSESGRGRNSGMWDAFINGTGALSVVVVYIAQALASSIQLFNFPW
jgi:hypothetical protein